MADANLNNPVGDLQERCMRDNLPLPIYTKMKKDGPEHSPTFTQKVTVLDYVAFGSGPKYQKAKYDAARKMIAILDDVSSPQSSKGDLSRQTESPAGDTSSFNEVSETSSLDSFDTSSQQIRQTEHDKSHNTTMMNVLLESLANLDKLESKRASEESFDVAKNEQKQGQISSPSISCEICCEPYQASKQAIDRRPRIYCCNGHNFCFRCSVLINECQNCKAMPTEPPEPNSELIKIIEDVTKANEKNFPEISMTELEKIQSDPVAVGAYADVYQCKWKLTPAALKQLRFQPKLKEFNSIKLEAGHGFNLHHRNIVQFYGLVRLNNGFMGIVMEWADQGSLREHLENLTEAQKISIPLGVCAGLDHLHSKHIAHRDLKPENILLFNSDLQPKISDFGTSKEIHTLTKNTARTGTFKYSAPELMDHGITYGVSVDVYSLSIVIYEIFSGLEPYPNYGDMQILKAKEKDEKPKFPEEFPLDLKNLILRGWSSDPAGRPQICIFQKTLDAMNAVVWHSNSPSRGKSPKLSEPHEPRFYSEYEPLENLGKGGFGIVVQARNKLDDVVYAVKRVVLPTDESEKNRVMKEVKVLAKLDHKNIVRYYNAWIETPPPDWEEPSDAWRTDSMTSGSFSTYSGDQTTSYDFGDSENEMSTQYSDKSTIDYEQEATDESQGETATPLQPQPFLYIVMQLCKKETLKDWLESNKTLDAIARGAKAREIFQQICLGVDYIHQQKHIHRDLKPSNIFFSTNDNTIKIGDFGLVTLFKAASDTNSHLTSGHSSQVGTELYKSPELQKGRNYNHKVDIYAMGIILFELLFPFQTEMERIKTLEGLRNLIFKQVRPEMSLVKMMLSHIPDERPEVSNILKRISDDQQTRTSPNRKEMNSV